MARYRHTLPPLDKLVFFEAVLRHGSFTRAAGELSVSQAAVSKQIRQLEDWLGVRLFERDPKRLVPTEAARGLGDRVRVALDFLDDAVGRIREPEKPVVQIASINAFGMFWLQPRLRAFGLSDDACPFNISLTDDPAAVLSEGTDIAVIYGDGNVPGWTTKWLLEETLVPVATPAVAKRLSDLQAIATPDFPLLDYEKRAPDWLDWAGWAALTDTVLPADAPQVLCSSYSHSVGRALTGHGVALASLPLLSEELAAGRLVKVGHSDITTKRSYWLAWPNNRSQSAEAQRIAKALLSLDPNSPPDIVQAASG